MKIENENTPYQRLGAENGVDGLSNGVVYSARQLLIKTLAKKGEDKLTSMFIKKHDELFQLNIRPMLNNAATLDKKIRKIKTDTKLNQKKKNNKIDLLTKEAEKMNEITLEKKNEMDKIKAEIHNLRLAQLFIQGKIELQQIKG